MCRPSKACHWNVGATGDTRAGGTCWPLQYRTGSLLPASLQRPIWFLQLSPGQKTTAGPKLEQNACALRQPAHLQYPSIVTLRCSAPLTRHIGIQPSQAWNSLEFGREQSSSPPLRQRLLHASLVTLPMDSQKWTRVASPPNGSPWKH